MTRAIFEFESDPIIVRSDTTMVSSVAGSGNQLSFQVDRPGFEVEVTGFDPHRDLKLATNASTEESEDDTTL